MMIIIALAVFAFLVTWIVLNTKRDCPDVTGMLSGYRKIGIQPYAFEWLDQLPYGIISEMKWDKQRGFYEIPGDAKVHLLYSLVDLYTGYITQVEMVEYWEGTKRVIRYYAMTFKEARGKDGQPHPNGGYYWVMLNE